MLLFFKWYIRELFLSINLLKNALIQGTNISFCLYCCDKDNEDEKRKQKKKVKIT